MSVNAGCIDRMVAVVHSEDVGLFKYAFSLLLFPQIAAETSGISAHDFVVAVSSSQVLCLVGSQLWNEAR